MPAEYSNLANVKAELPSSLPAGLTDPTITGYIQIASSQVDAEVGPAYPFAYVTNTQKFPQKGSSPDTPGLIEKITRYIAAADCWAFMGETPPETGKSNQDRLKEWAAEMLTLIRSGEIVISSNGVRLISVSMDYVTWRDADEVVFTDSNLDTHLGTVS